MFTIEPEFLPNSRYYVSIDLEFGNGVDGWLEGHLI